MLSSWRSKFGFRLCKFRDPMLYFGATAVCSLHSWVDNIRRVAGGERALGPLAAGFTIAPVLAREDGVASPRPWLTTCKMCRASQAGGSPCNQCFSGARRSKWYDSEAQRGGTAWLAGETIPSTHSSALTEFAPRSRGQSRGWDWRGLATRRGGVASPGDWRYSKALLAAFHFISFPTAVVALVPLGS
eukprot:gene10579-biopygen1700